MVAGLSRLGRLLVTLGMDTREFDRGMQRAESRARRAEQAFRDVGRQLSLAVTAPIVGVGTLIARESLAFEQGFARVAKTTSATASELEVLRSELEAIERRAPASAQEILRVAETAGQLNIAKEDIAEFTQVMVELGTATNLTAERGAVQLARLAGITGIAGAEFRNLASALVDLGNNSRTTESEILTVALRIAGAGEAVGITAADILGFSTAITSAGVQAEAGGTAFTRMAIEIAKAVKQGSQSLSLIAAVANQTAQEFVESYQQDAGKAITQFIEGLRSVDQRGGEVFETLDRLAFGGIRTTRTLLSLSESIGLTAEQVERSRRAFSDGTASLVEYERLLATTQSQMRVVQNQIIQLARGFGDQLTPAILPVLTFVRDAIQGFRDWSRGFEQTTIKAAALLASIGPLVLAVGTLTASIRGIGRLLSFGFAGPLGIVAGSALAAVAALQGFIAVLSLVDDTTKRTIQGPTELGVQLKQLQQDSERAREELARLQSQLEQAQSGTLPTEGILRTGRYEEFLARVVESTKKGIADITQEIGELDRRISDVRAGVVIEEMSKKIGAAKQAFSATKDAVGEFDASLRLAEQEVAAYEIALNSLIAIQGVEQDQVDLVARGLGLATERLRELREEQLQTTETTGLMAEVMRALDEQIGLVQERIATTKFSDPAESALDVWEEFQRNVRVTGGELVKTATSFVDRSVQAFGDGIGRAIAFGDDFGKVMEGVWRSVLANAISALVQIAGQAIISAIVGKTAAELAAESWVTAYGKATAAAQFFYAAAVPGGILVAPGVATAAASLFAGTIESIGVGLRALGTLGRTATAGGTLGQLSVTGFSSGVIGSVPALHEGGVVFGPTLAIVGDRGPERIEPLDRFDAREGGGRSIVIQNIVDGKMVSSRVVRELDETILNEIGSILP